MSTFSYLLEKGERLADLYILVNLLIKGNLEKGEYTLLFL